MDWNRKSVLMKYFGKGLSELHKELNMVIRKQDKFSDAKRLFSMLHSQLHLSEVYDVKPNEVDALLEELLPYEYRIMPTREDETIAWVLWHISRIEDLTMNILVADQEQIFDGKWKTGLNAPIVDTGNALSDSEIMNLSSMLDIGALVAYRNAVGRRTREIIKELSAEDMKHKVVSKRLDRIREIGGVTEQESSLWLLEFWGKKDIAGLLLMPPTRHMIMHLNDCCKWKEHMRSGKKCFLGL